MNKFRLLTEEEKGPQRIPKSFLAVVNIGYIFFPSEKLSKFVKNESNNENWDTIDDYIAKIKEWNEKVEKQLELVKKVENAYQNEEEVSEEDDWLAASCQVHLQEWTNDSLSFIWTVPKNNEDKVILAEVPNYLFNYRGEWYEVNNWKVWDTEKVSVQAVKSIFYNYYWHVANTATNGIIHHSPHGQVEINSCPQYDDKDVVLYFVGDFEMNLSLYRVATNPWEKDWGVRTVRNISNQIPLIIGELPMTKVEGEDQIAEEIKNNWFSKQYILLDDKLGNDFVRHRRNPVHWKLVGEWNEERQEYDLAKDGLEEELVRAGLLFGDEKTGFSVRHEAKYFFRNEMSARIFWRGMPKTEGMNFYETYNRVMTNSMIRLQSSKEKTKGAGMETIT